MTYSLRLDTSRLTIVGINEIHISQLRSYYKQNQEHLKFGGGKVPATDADVEALHQVWANNILNDTEVRFFLQKEAQIIGVVGITNIVRGGFHAAYLGYHIAERFQGQGYMTEALEEIIYFTFSGLNLHRLMANYRPTNIASGRVLEKLGFVKEGLAKDYLMVNGQWADHILTSKTNNHWKAR